MALGGSYDYGKAEIATFIKERFPLGSFILDVGAGGGKYGFMLGCGYILDAVEVWPESVEYLKSLFMYRNVIESDIRNVNYGDSMYDLIIFGDVLEHLTVEDAQAVLAEAEKHSKHILIGIPYMLPQDEIDGNEAEIHRQPDLTYQNFKERYPGYELVFGRFDLYGYYYK